MIRVRPSPLGVLLLLVLSWEQLLQEAASLSPSGQSLVWGIGRRRSDHIARSTRIRGGDLPETTTAAATTTSAESSATPGLDPDAAAGAASTSAGPGEDGLSLDQKVHAAMLKLGLRPPTVSLDQSTDNNDSSNSLLSNAAATCDASSGVCELPVTASAVPTSADAKPIERVDTSNDNIDPQSMAQSISKDMSVDISMAWAALGATSASEGSSRVYNEQAARDMIQVELDMIAQIDESADEVQQLVAEGYDNFMVRRALAFAERNVDDARAILLADKMDEEEEMARLRAEEEQALALEKQRTAPFKTVKVAASFDPAKLSAGSDAATAAATDVFGKAPATGPTQTVSRESVIFEATASQVQELVLESPVPVLLDIYADWCGPCKALSPILEEMAVKGAGAFRLVKVNADNERPIAHSALEVTALPTIFAIRHGKILHMFQGMPKSQDMMKNFLMGLLIPGQAFSPPVTETEQQKYAELSAKLLKVASSSAFSFSARERLHDKVMSRLDDLAVQTGNDVYLAEQSASTVRSLLSNILRDPHEQKFRSINLANTVIKAKIAQYPACIAMLKGIGFVPDGDAALKIGKGKALFNVAPLSVTREAIDKWIDKTRYEVARAGRQRRDEADRVLVQAELAQAAEEAKRAREEAAAAEEAATDPNTCRLKLRLDGKKKVHECVLAADDPLDAILDQLPGVSVANGEEYQITCVAKRLVVQSSDKEAMKKSLREHGLMPNSVVVVRPIPAESTTRDDATPEEGVATATDAARKGKSGAASRLAQRAAAKKKTKKGTHTMQSIGIYAKDDNAKGELVDGGGGTLYEQDVSDDEEETQVTESQAQSQEGNGNKASDTNPDEPTEQTEE